MEFFHEIYSAYFQVVRKILLESAKSPLTTGEMKQISQSYAFEESFLSIIPLAPYICYKNWSYSCFITKETRVGSR